jgi:hypothetical protein
VITLELSTTNGNVLIKLENPEANDLLIDIDNVEHVNGKETETLDEFRTSLGCILDAQKV